jgi:hypothetical protein
VGSTHESAISGVGSAVFSKGNPVIDLDFVSAQALAAGLRISKLTLPLISLPDRVPDGGGNVASRLGRELA